jgi:hypothetical protein
VFDRLKALFTEAPILVHFHPEKPTVVETDASDFALGAVLSQVQPEESSRLHPVAYYSRKLTAAEIIWPEGPSILQNSTLRSNIAQAIGTPRQTSYRGVGTTPLRRGVKLKKSACSNLEST